MNTADIFSLLHLFHLFTFLWHRPTLSKRCISSFKAVGLGLFPFLTAYLRETNGSKRCRLPITFASYPSINQTTDGINVKRPIPTALFSLCADLAGQVVITPNPALPTDQPLRGSQYNEFLLSQAFVLVFEFVIRCHAFRTRWGQVKKWLSCQLSLRCSQ